MRRKGDIQISVSSQTKDLLDYIKIRHKDDILKHLKKKKRFVSNSDVIEFLLDKNAKKKEVRK